MQEDKRSLAERNINLVASERDHYLEQNKALIAQLHQLRGDLWAAHAGSRNFWELRRRVGAILDGKAEVVIEDRTTLFEGAINEMVELEERFGREFVEDYIKRLSEAAAAHWDAAIIGAPTEEAR